MAEPRFPSSLPRGRSGAGGAARGRATGALFVRADERDVVGLLRDLQGRFTNTQGEAINVYYRMGLRLADLMVEEQRKGMVRKGASSGKLAKALRDPRNIDADRFGVGVGNLQWLDSSAAKYWRQIESGYTGHVGREIRGVWGVGPDREGRRPGGPYSYFGASTGGNLFPGLQAGRRAMSDNPAARERGGPRAMVGVIRRPIVAQHYMLRAWRRFRPTLVARQLMAQLYPPMPRRP